MDAHVKWMHMYIYLSPIKIDMYQFTMQYTLIHECFITNVTSNNIK